MTDWGLTLKDLQDHDVLLKVDVGFGWHNKPTEEFKRKLARLGDCMQMVAVNAVMQFLSEEGLGIPPGTPAADFIVTEKGVEKIRVPVGGHDA